MAAGGLRGFPLAPFERDGLRAALAKAKLPTDDITQAGRLFWRFEREDMLVGFGGLEVHGRDALVRSVVTLPPLRKRGIGAAIVASLETEAFVAGCRVAWLLTTAAPFFGRLGYVPHERTDVPESIRKTQEFAALCPASAVVMSKPLA
jgi:N-acetylglutamate synthase-like GNAT family acetyltransferase